MRLILLAWCAIVSLTAAASAEESGWQTSWDGTAYAYADRMEVRSDSETNPGNRIARLAENQNNIEARFNLKAENTILRFTARPVVAMRDAHNAFDDELHQEAYLSQWQLKMKAAGNVNLTAGREVLNWGAAQFRSPSSPFYFDNGRSNPMRELSGIDLLKVALTTKDQGSAQLVRVLGLGHASPEPNPWSDSWLVKYDRHGTEWAAGLVAVTPRNHAAFLGAHGQFTLSDALLAYGELSSSTELNTLTSPADLARPYSVTPESSRQLTELLGLAYTLEGGQSLNAEYLHDGHGFHAAEAEAYFKRAETQPALALGLAPRLLGRDYLHLVWQGNPMDSSNYWRLMYTHGLTDGGNELGGYGEYSLNPHLIVFLLGVLPIGSARQEFSSLFRYSVTAGLKVPLP